MLAVSNCGSAEEWQSTYEEVVLFNRKTHKAYLRIFDKVNDGGILIVARLCSAAMDPPL